MLLRVEDEQRVVCRIEWCVFAPRPCVRVVNLVTLCHCHSYLTAPFDFVEESRVDDHMLGRLGLLGGVVQYKRRTTPRRIRGINHQSELLSGLCIWCSSCEVGCMYRQGTMHVGGQRYYPLGLPTTLLRCSNNE
jgi:hypothetical protein